MLLKYDYNSIELYIKMATMELKIISEVHKEEKSQDKTNFVIQDNELEECLSFLPEEYAPQDHQYSGINSSQQPHMKPQKHWVVLVWMPPLHPSIFAFQSPSK